MEKQNLSESDITRFGADPKKTFEENLIKVQEKMALAARRSKRNPESIKLLPITKTVPAHVLRYAHEAGIRNFGENKIQEAQEKFNSLSDLPIQWNIVGHLQSNKVKQLLSFANEFQALDSLKLAALLNKQCDLLGRDLDVFIQVNTSHEASKFGLPPHELESFIEALKEYPRLQPKGLMTLAILSGDQNKVRECFKILKKLRDRSNILDSRIAQLSMGMSGDFEIAIEEGADVVRVGQAIFGKRPTPDSLYWPEEKN